MARIKKKPISNKVELLAPAGNLEKLKIAYLYGADAVYAGGKKFSLRARASNFSSGDIEEAARFAKSLNKKLYITMNIVPHESDLDDLEEYLIFLEKVGVTGIIISSLYIASVARRVAPNLELHLSTQASASNHQSVAFYKSFGFKRVVLARELDIKEIKNLVSNTDLEIEVFIHGGMCISYSGRCMLSNYMTNRDANRGGCAHSCRWNYDIYSGNKKLNNRYFNMGSKDLNSYKQIFDLIDTGVSSLKIEGRMKSLFYIACIVRTYRDLIDDYYEFMGDKTKVDFDYYNNEILKAENRLTSVGFLKGPVTKNEQLYNIRNENPTKDFLGIVLDYDEKTKIATIEQRNYFKSGDSVEFFGPNLKNTSYVIPRMETEDGDEIDIARHPLQIIKFIVPFKLQKNDMMRK
ncbi:MAG: U32 family peptidase [Bacilli bacterium]|nr:U32 family peptidase [Bacilli bacterium]